MKRSEILSYGFVFLGGALCFLGLSFLGDTAKEVKAQAPSPQATSSGFVSYDSEFDHELEKYFSKITDTQNDVDAIRLAQEFGLSGDVEGEDVDPSGGDSLPMHAFIPVGKPVNPDGKVLVSMANLGNVPNNPFKGIPNDSDMPPLTDLNEADLDGPNPLSVPKGDSLIEAPNKASLPAGFKTVAYKGAKKVPGQYYTIKSGDSLWKIANKHGKSLSKILKLNPHLRGRIIHPGDKILIKRGKAAVQTKSTKKKKKYYKKSKSKSKTVKRKGHRKTKYYRVRAGDTLNKIGRKFGVSVRNLKKRNGIRSNLILVGQRLKIKHYYKKGSKKHYQKGQPEPEFETPDFKVVKKRLFDWPVRGKITSFYGFRRDPFNKRKKQ